MAVERHRLSSDTFGGASHHLYLECLRAIFDLAMVDMAISEKPSRADTIKRKKKERPIRLTPTFEEFERIVVGIRQWQTLFWTKPSL